MWRDLRGRRLGHFKFRRQHAVGEFILDFYCSEARLAVEVDGGGHAQGEQERLDAQRTAILGTHGIRVLRFWNHEVLTKTEAVLEEILRVLRNQVASSSAE